MNNGNFQIKIDYLCTLMEKFVHINNANDFAKEFGAPVLHPMVCVVHFDELGPIHHVLNKMGVYAIFVQDNFPTGEPTA